MIFVTVGTHNQGFERLVQKMDEIACEIDEEVVMQIGFTEYKPENAKWFKFVDIGEIMNFYKNADVIVTHAGAGALLDALSFEKPIIAVPRLKKFGEHIDDQQLELTEALENKGQIKAVYEIDDLEGFIGENRVKHEIKKSKELLNFLNYYLNS
ncbi:MAG: PssE/Cps14G family polysaccharide biosynthesis glycosyltransferase [Methanobacterium sp.]